jgi:hypothetical protein
MVKIWNFETSADVFIRQLSWNFQCDTLLLFNEKRRMTPYEKNVFVINEKTMGGTK